MRTLSVCTVAVLLTVMTASCQKRGEGAELLWLPPGATIDEGPQTFRDGSAALRFSLTGSQPDELSGQILEHFAGRQWHSHEPALSVYPPAKSTGWQAFKGGGVIPVDAHGRPLPPQETLYWHGEWKDNHGAEIRYRLTATRPIGNGSYRIVGYATYAPRAVVEMTDRR